MKTAAVKRLCVVGSSGMVGGALLSAAVGRSDVRLIGIARREVDLPKGARMEMMLADPEGWPDAIAAANAHVLVCALGTTMANVDGNEDAFRSVDRDLVMATGRAARSAGIDHMIVISSVGADDTSTHLYLKTKGEMEAGLRKLGFRRLDVLRPGLLVGKRQESRLWERAVMWLMPILNLFLHGKWKKFRSIKAKRVAEAVFALAHARPGGVFGHEFDGMKRAIQRAGDYSENGPNS